MKTNNKEETFTQAQQCSKVALRGPLREIEDVKYNSLKKDLFMCL